MDLFYACFRPPKKSIRYFYRCAKFIWNWRSSFDYMRVLVLRLDKGFIPPPASPSVIPIPMSKLVPRHVTQLRDCSGEQRAGGWSALSVAHVAGGQWRHWDPPWHLTSLVDVTSTVVTLTTSASQRHDTAVASSASWHWRPANDARSAASTTSSLLETSARSALTTFSLDRSRGRVTGVNSEGL